ncbi:MAG TPA: DUF11 domain-containing protein, partial [Acidimicrobiia bacterium]|nr:DUF11 domain-containing protein [Acidimicrobiia bacterium]
PPDVAVVKTAPAQVSLGDTITYTITATNTGTVDADHVTVSDSTPTNATFISIDAHGAACNAVDNGIGVEGITFHCDVGTLHPGGTWVITVVVKPLHVGTVDNTATVTPAGLVPAAGPRASAVGRSGAPSEVGTSGPSPGATPGGPRSPSPIQG